jgi:hypothetical protein
MKVFNLSCEQSHLFEGWFASAQAFESQQMQGLVQCPVCGSSTVSKQLSAPRLNLSGAQEPVPQHAKHAQSIQQEVMSSGMQAKLLHMMREYVANTENVGERFAEEARKIHYGEAQERSIRGVASEQERQSLADEGIETFAMPVPRFLTEPSQ